MISAFGVDHGGEVSKLDDQQKKQAAAGTAVGVGGAAAASQVRVPEHSHYNKKTRAYLHTLPAGVHEVDTAMLGKRPRKLGARKQQTPYVAAMAQERPAPYSPVPITRYKGDKGVIQRDNAHSVMANAMKGRKTTIKIEDSPHHRPVRPAGEEAVRRLQGRYQQRRLRQNTNLSEKKINQHVKAYKPSSRKANTTKRPHGVIEDQIKSSRHKYGAKVALGLIRKDQRRRDTAAGAAGVAGGGVLATTPVRRSGAKVKIHETKSGPRIRSAEAKKIVSPGYRPGNRRAIQGMAHKLPKNAQGPTKVIRYKGGQVIPWDGNHRATARIARGDKSIPVKVIEGGERPAVSVTRNAIHVGQQRVHQRRMNRGDFTSLGKPSKPGKAYHAIANASPTRSGRKELTTVRAASGPTKAALRTKQGATVTAGAALLGTAHHLNRKKD